MAGGAETRVVVSSVYDAICINPCKWFEQALKATLRCLGFDSVITSESPQAADYYQEDEECFRTEPLILGPNGLDDKKEADGNFNEPDVVTCADSRGSSSSSSSNSSSSSRDDHQEQADLNPSITDPGTEDPIYESSDPSVLALGRSRMPPRPPVSSGRGGQTN